MHLVTAVFVLQVSPDFLHEVRSQRIWIVLQVQLDWLCLSVGRLLGRDLSILEHRIYNKVAALESTIRMQDRRIVARRFGKSSEKGGLVQGQSLRGFTEIVFRS